MDPCRCRPRLDDVVQPGARSWPVARFASTRCPAVSPTATTASSRRRPPGGGAAVDRSSRAARRSTATPSTRTPRRGGRRGRPARCSPTSRTSARWSSMDRRPDLDRRGPRRQRDARAGSRPPAGSCTPARGSPPTSTCSRCSGATSTWCCAAATGCRAATSTSCRRSPRSSDAMAVRPQPTVPCHNDLLPANMMADGERIWFIDFEYSGNGDPCFELGNIWSEAQLRRRPAGRAGRGVLRSRRRQARSPAPGCSR